mgnify:CR=1 FL=1
MLEQRVAPVTRRAKAVVRLYLFEGRIREEPSELRSTIAIWQGRIELGLM